MLPSTMARLRTWLVSGLPPAPAGEGDALELVRAAGHQGLAGLLHETVHGNPGWPPGALDLLRGAHRRALRDGLLQLDLLEDTRARLAARGVRSLPLKGAALAESLYASVAERPMADVDLLVLNRWPDALAELDRAGFTLEEAADHACCFRAATGQRLELHHALTSCPGLHPLDRDGLWERSRSGPGQVTRLPGHEDLFVQLCRHAAFQHGLVLSLIQHLDLRRWLDRGPVDVQRLATLAFHQHADTDVALALAAAEIVVGAQVPDELRAAFPLPRGLRRWLDERRTRPLTLVAPAAPDLLRVRWGLVAGRRAAFVRGTLLPRLPGVRVAAWRVPWHVLRRGVHLAGRWTLRPHRIRATLVRS